MIPVEVGRHSIEGTAKLLRTLRESFDMEDENIDYIIIQNKRDERDHRQFGAGASRSVVEKMTRPVTDYLSNKTHERN